MQTCRYLTTRGFDFTNIFTRRFYAFSSQKRKSQSSRQYLFTLLGSARVKAVRRTLMKLSHGQILMKVSLLQNFDKKPLLLCQPTFLTMSTNKLLGGDFNEQREGKRGFCDFK